MFGTHPLKEQIPTIQRDAIPSELMTKLTRKEAFSVGSGEYSLDPASGLDIGEVAEAPEDMFYCPAVLPRHRRCADRLQYLLTHVFATRFVHPGHACEVFVG
jgi:hypothetical protein